MVDIWGEGCEGFSGVALGHIVPPSEPRHLFAALGDQNLGKGRDPDPGLEDAALIHMPKTGRDSLLLRGIHTFPVRWLAPRI